MKSSFQRQVLKNIFGKCSIRMVNVSFPRCLLSKSLCSGIYTHLIYLLKYPFHCLENIAKDEGRKRAQIQIVQFFFLIIDENLSQVEIW